jgi:hypothetical protein
LERSETAKSVVTGLIVNEDVEDPDIFCARPPIEAVTNMMRNMTECLIIALDL